MSRNPTADQGAARLRQAVLVSALFCVAGCTNLGPRTIQPDRINYNNAVAESWKQQALLNIVKLRYGDAPVFIEVASIIGGYTMEQKGDLGWGGQQKTNYNWLSSLSVSSSSTFTDRPTITYSPLTGAKFIQNMMAPIPPKSLLLMIQSGWPAEPLMQYTVQTVNGHRNRCSMGGKRMAGDPSFFKLISLFGEVQISGAIGMQLEKDEKGQETVNMILRDQQVSPEVAEKIREVRKMLALRADAQKFRLTSGGFAEDDLDISLQTRSVFQILIDLASYVEAPPKHIEDGQVEKPLPVAPGAMPPIRVHSGRWKPDNAFAAVQYGGYWYWVDRRDRVSKRTIAFMVLLFAISEPGDKEVAPTVTISAG